MRHHFVAHQGQRGLEIKAAGTRYSYNFGDLATQMGELIQKNVVDPELRKWIIPDFTTTTADDIIISSVIMMSTLQKYFNYKCCLLCGLPAVTLLGEKSDWENILQRTEKLVKYGEVAIHWHNLLKPVLTGLINTFSNPDSEDTKNFWQSIAHCQGGGSGPTYLSGWITAFCFFDSHGASLYDKSHIRRVHDDTLLKLGNATFHVVDTDDIPPAYAAVPVLLDDNGVKVKTVMVAGLLGTRVTGNKGTVQPQAAWWIAEDLSEKET
ncbi:hypothetical protein BGX28_006876 [Mortierella sp. GBA30]|nr:hypothetical protein BGX28_006876 [Mortierella sp. GBA30]